MGANDEHGYEDWLHWGVVEQLSKTIKLSYKNTNKNFHWDLKICKLSSEYLLNHVAQFCSFSISFQLSPQL
jgi:galactose mutarotase-like enzyme